MQTKHEFDSWSLILLLLCYFCGCFSVSIGRVRVKRTVIQTDRMTFGGMTIFIQESYWKSLYFCNLMYNFSERNEIFSDIIYSTSLDLINLNLIEKCQVLISVWLFVRIFNIFLDYSAVVFEESIHLSNSENIHRCQSARQMSGDSMSSSPLSDCSHETKWENAVYIILI